MLAQQARSGLHAALMPLACSTEGQSAVVSVQVPCARDYGIFCRLARDGAADTLHVPVALQAEVRPKRKSITVPTAQVGMSIVATASAAAAAACARQHMSAWQQKQLHIGPLVQQCCVVLLQHP